MRCKVVLIVCLAGMLLSRFASAAVIVVGDHELLPDTPNQLVPIFVTGGDAVQGLNLYAQIADGGPAAGGTILGPAVTDADVLTGTIFELNNTGVQDPGSVAQLIARTVTTDTGSVPATGLLATLKISTVGFTSGTWALNLGNTRSGPTDFTIVPITITDGSIKIVPEPVMIAPLILVLIPLSRRRTARLSHPR
jgi:hypothetical protein